MLFEQKLAPPVLFPGGLIMARSHRAMMSPPGNKTGGASFCSKSIRNEISEPRPDAAVRAILCSQI